MMIFETASFLYSLFDDNSGSTNLLRIWQGFDHLFNNELREFAEKLKPFKKDLGQTRNRIGFHGSLTRKHERGGLNLFDVSNPRVREFARLLLEMRNLAIKMIDWYIKKKFGEPENTNKLLSAFVTELQGYEVTKKQWSVTPKSSIP